MKQAYPIFIAQCGTDYLVYVPDFDSYTEGIDIANAIEMARDVIGLKGVDFENDGKKIPESSTYQAAIVKAKEDISEFDYTQGILTMVDVDFSEYRKKMNNKMVRRNVTLPNWLNVEADKLKLNVSKVLQDALIDRVSEMR